MNTDRELMQQALDALEQVAEYFSDDSTEAKTITALRERLAQPEQEPVATLDDLEQEIYENTRQFVSRDVMEWMLKRYYTTPPQRKPLTDEQTMAGYKLACSYGVYESNAFALTEKMFLIFKENT